MTPECPLAAADRRLCDGLNLWVETKSSYFDPDSFRRCLNSTIQTLRNVTFIVQKAKSNLANFDAWYAPWQERMRCDSRMRWLVDSRNVIVKQGDLETYSRVRLSVIRSWHDSPIVEVSVPPFTPTAQFERHLMAGMKTTSKLRDGLLKIERRWIDSRLPSDEILETLAHAFNVLTRLLHDAHLHFLAQPIRTTCPWFSMAESLIGRLPPCMLGLAWDRTLWLDLESGSIAVPRTTSIDEPLPNPTVLSQRYGDIESCFRPMHAPSDLKNTAEAFFKQAKRVLTTDGYHIPLAILFFPNGRSTVARLQMNSRSEKHLVMRQLAADVERQGATSVIIIGEAWVSRGGSLPPSGHAADDPNRKECLQLVALDSDGQELEFTVMFLREAEGAIRLTEETSSSADGMNMIQPIRDAWRRQRAARDK